MKWPEAISSPIAGSAHVLFHRSVIRLPSGKSRTSKRKPMSLQLPVEVGGYSTGQSRNRLRRGREDDSACLEGHLVAFGVLRFGVFGEGEVEVHLSIGA